MGFAASLDPNLYIAALEFELGDIFLDKKFDELFEFFLIHSLRPNGCPNVLIHRERAGAEVVLDLNDYQFLVARLQHFATLLGHQDHVFDANAPLPGQIYTWLDGDHHAGSQDVFNAGRDAGCLVHL